MKRIRITPSPPRNLRPAAAVTARAFGADERRVQRRDDALDFMRNVRRVFEPTKYHEFLDAIKQFQLGSVSVRGVVDRVKVLFRGHPDLKRQFNMFVPAEYHLSLSDDGDQQ